MTYERVAVISDVHGNAPALEAVLAEIAALDVDLIVSCGDLLAGPLPVETAALLEPLGDRVRYVRGNADREVAHIYDGGGSPFAGPTHAAAVIGPRASGRCSTRSRRRSSSTSTAWATSAAATARRPRTRRS